MTGEFNAVVTEIRSAVHVWAHRLAALPEETIFGRVNAQGRNIRQILGHMADSASNNTHRIIHLQYGESPLEFPNYAACGNNDRWIAIQDYRTENWSDLVGLWKYTHRHIAHVISRIDPAKLENEWIAGPDRRISLRAMALDFPRHLNLHLDEIYALINEEEPVK